MNFKMKSNTEIVWVFYKSWVLSGPEPNKNWFEAEKMVQIIVFKIVGIKINFVIFTLLKFFTCITWFIIGLMTELGSKGKQIAN